MSDLLRRLITNYLTESKEDELRRELEELKAGQKKLRGDFATLAQVLLIKVAKEDPEKVSGWIQKHLAR